jgi:hypothetical protein
MKIIIKDNQGKQMVFDTLYEVEEESCKNEKTFICEEWIWISGERMDEWCGIRKKHTEVTNER